MQITLQKVSNTHHLLRCTRDDGSIEEAELETKSFLVHDLTHLAYEQASGLKHSFWGRVANGEGFLALREVIDPNEMNMNKNELLQTEMIVGPLQSVMQDRQSAEDLLRGLERLFIGHDAMLPAFLTTELLQTTKDRFQRLFGEWQSLAFGERMTVEWNAYEAFTF